MHHFQHMLSLNKLSVHLLAASCNTSFIDTATSKQTHRLLSKLPVRHMGHVEVATQDMLQL